jgi:phosphinothricin acetyltransferase
VIRPASNADVEAMLAIYGPVVTTTAISFELAVPSAEEMTERLARIQATDPWLVLEIGGDVAGYAYGSPFRARAAYEPTRETTVYVDPDHRGQGVARRLMEELLVQLAHRGAHRAVAGIVLPNEASVALHRSLGFTHIGTFTEVGWKLDAWHDLSFWERAL